MSKNINRYCVYEYYESEDAKNPYYVGEGVTDSRPYKRHPVTATLKRKVKEQPHRFSEKVTEIIKSGDLVPKDLLMIKIVKKDLTKMESCLEETKLIKKYGRLTKLIWNEENSLVNVQPGFDENMMEMIRLNPNLISKLNKAYELALEKDNKTYSIQSSLDAQRLLENYGTKEFFEYMVREEKEQRKKQKKQRKKQKNTVNRRKQLNKHLKYTIEHAKKYPHEKFTKHQIKLIEKLYGLIKKVK